MRNVIEHSIPKQTIAFILLISLVGGCTETSKESLPKATTKSKASDAQKITIVAWNVESGKSDVNAIASQLAELSGHDIYCLSEVNSSNFETSDDNSSET